jgi:hypothetical protein
VCRTGQILVMHCVHPPGPAMTLRMARLWIRGHGPDRCEASSQLKLSLIHTPESELIRIEPLFPFGYRCSCGFLQNDIRQEFEYLLQLRDDKVFLMYCSTSPEHEEEDFCKSTRESFQYMLKQLKTVNLTTCITPAAPRLYCRVNRSSNTWMMTREDHV